MSDFAIAQQENVLTILAHSDKYGRIISQIVEPELFEGDYRLIAERCTEYWRDNGEAPKLHTHDLFADMLENGRRAGTFKSILNDMVRLSADINGDYVVREISKFTRLQKLKEAIQSAAETLSRPTPTTIVEIEELLSDILRARDHALDAGMTLRDTERLFDYIETQYEEFTTGIPQFDSANIVPARGTVHLFIAGKGRGKSWWLVNLGKRALQTQKRVLHVSLEMSEEEMLQRYMQAMFGMPKRYAMVRGARIENTVLDLVRGNFDREGETTKLIGLDRMPIPIELAFDTPEVRMELGVRVEMLGPRADNLLVKRFPTRRLTPAGLAGFLDGIEMTHKFVPDIVLLDYIGLMHTQANVKDHHNALARNFEECRALAIERNFALCTAHQITREGFKSKTAHSTDVAEAWGLIHTADVTITHSATATEQRHGLARLFVAHARQERDKFGVLVTQNFEIGQFVLQSIPLPSDYFDFEEKLKKEDKDASAARDEDDD